MKRIFVKLLILTVAFVLAACTNESCKNILGKWLLAQTLDTEISTEEANAQSPDAVVRYKMQNSFEFFADGTFVSASTQEFQNFTPLTENATEIDEAEIQKFFLQSLQMRGVFKINKSTLRYEIQFIKIGDDEMPYAQYLQQNDLPLSESVVAVSYKIENDELIINRGADANEALVYKKQK